MPITHRKPSMKQVDLTAPDAASELKKVYERAVAEKARAQVIKHAMSDHIRALLQAKKSSPLDYLAESRFHYSLMRPKLCRIQEEPSNSTKRFLKNIFEWPTSANATIRAMRVFGPEGLEAWWLTQNPEANYWIGSMPPAHRHYLPVPDAREAELVALESVGPDLEPATVTALDQAQEALNLRVTQEFARHPGNGVRTRFTRKRTMKALSLAAELRDDNVDPTRRYRGVAPF